MKKPKPYALKKIDEILLRVLEPGEFYGSEILAIIQRASFGNRKILFGSLYPKLQSLQTAGFIQGTSKPSSGGGGTRIYYRLTPAGKEALETIKNFETRLSLGNALVESQADQLNH